MPEYKPVTDDELAEMLRMETERTPGEWEWEAADASLLGLGVKGTALMEGAVLACTRCAACQEHDKPCMWPAKPNADYIAACTRVVKRMAMELAELRAHPAKAFERLGYHDVAEFYKDAE